MKNKNFLLLSLAVVVLSFMALHFFNKSPLTPDEPKAVIISNDILIKFHSPMIGDSNAPVTLVEFLDPECEACRAMHPIVKELMNLYEGKVRLVIRYTPFHANSLYAAAVLEEARELGKFSEALDILFREQPKWGNHHNPRPDLIPGFLSELGIPAKNLEKETVIHKHREKVDMDQADAEKAGVRATPTFFVNGKMLKEIGYQALQKAIEEALN